MNQNKPINITNSAALILLTVLIGLALWVLKMPSFQSTPQPENFDGSRALEDIAHQLSLGPRIPGTVGHAKMVEWLEDELAGQGWGVIIQEATYLEKPIRNVIARRAGSAEDVPWIILGAHYDTRIHADQDPDPTKQNLPVLGANDGASGVAVLTELARTIPQDFPGEIWLVFFDAEDNGRLPGWDWILGSRAFVEQLEDLPDAVIIVDMIGDADLNIMMERNSDPTLVAELWEQAAALGFSNHFIAVPGYSILDDHTPFLEAGIPAVDIIDFDYPYWHTTEDTIDKVSAESLQIVGETLLAWLESKR
ncbi:MAG: M28 family peptidase [Anaerolineales bacterium]|nr:M28 family peptidase [Anaerolineales bacterium]